jgi:hypothetical protein
MHDLQYFPNALIPQGKRIPWLYAYPLMHRLLHFFIGPQSLPTKNLLEWSRDVIVTRGEARRVRRVRESLEGNISGRVSCHTVSMWPGVFMQQ